MEKEQRVERYMRSLSLNYVLSAVVSEWVAAVGLLPIKAKKLLFSAIICLFLDLTENHSVETLTV